MYLRIHVANTGEKVGRGTARKFSAAVSRLYYTWYQAQYGGGNRRRTVATCQRLAYTSTSAVYHVQMGYRPDHRSNTYTLDPLIVVHADYKRGELR